VGGLARFRAAVLACTASIVLQSVLIVPAHAANGPRAVSQPDPAALPADPPMHQQPTPTAPWSHGPRTEIASLRNTDSRTFLNGDGTYTTDYTPGVFNYQDQNGVWQQLDVQAVPSDETGIAYKSQGSPVALRFASSSLGEVVSISAGSRSAGYRPTTPSDRNGSAPPADIVPTSDDTHVTYPGVFPGVDLRYTLLDDGVKEDLILHQPGDVYRFAFALDIPGLSAELEADGSVQLKYHGSIVFVLPKPFMVDSSPERSGRGARSEAVDYSLEQQGSTTVIVVEADPGWLDDPARVYPVFIDPTTLSYSTTLDTFITSAYPTSSHDAYWNPNEGGYYELWNGYYDSTSGTNYAYVKTALPSAVTVISATFKVFVQHSYMGATPTGIQLGKLTSSFSAGQTWNMTQPSWVALTSTTVADNQTASFNVTSIVQDWVYGAATNYGFRIYESSNSQTLWKRLRASENASNPPTLSVTWTHPAVTQVSPINTTWTKSSTMTWSYSDGGSGLGQARYWVQISNSSTDYTGTHLIADSTALSGATSTWTAPTTGFINGTTYYWHVSVGDGHSWSGFTSSAAFKWDAALPTFTSTTITGAVTAADPNYYFLGNGTATVKIRGADANSGIKLSYQRLYNATDEDRVDHDWSVGGTHCNEFNTSTLVDVTACSETYNSGGTREVQYTDLGLSSNTTFDLEYYFTDYAGNTLGYVDTGKNLIFDNTAPTGAITSPAASATVNGSVPVTGTASDTNFSQYILDYGSGASPTTWTSIGTFTTQVTNGTLGTWNVGSLAYGTWTVRLRVYDKARVSSGYTTVTRTVTVDNSLPVANISAPAASAFVAGTVTITGSASAPSGFVNYTVHYGSGCSPSTWTDIGTNPRTSQVTNGTLGTWTTTGLNGSYTIRLITTKTGGVTKTATVCLTVDNTGPTASLTAPASNAPLTGDVTVTGSATDNLGLSDYILDYGAGASPSSWTTITTSTSSVSNGTLGTWSTFGLSGVYTLRETVHDKAGNAAAVVTRLVYPETAQRGDAGYVTRVPFDLGGGLQLAVGVANGEATLERDLFSIPSYGPPQSLSLAYSSLEASSAGKFGVSWVSNLTQYLTFESGFVVWHAEDGGRVPFGNVAGSWTPVSGRYETLAAVGSTYVVTRKDQSTLTFENAGAGRLLAITNRFGKALSLVWNNSTATATDASGRATTLTIDAANNRITAASDSAGRAWGFGYSAANDLTSLTDPANAVTTLAYDASHHLTSISRLRTSADNSTATIVWSVAYTSGKVSTVTDPIGAAVSPVARHAFSYAAGATGVDLLRDMSVPSAPVLNHSDYTYDGHGWVTAVTDPEGWTTTRAYDANGNLLSITRPIDGSTSATTTYTYDPRGNTLTQVSPLDASSSVTSTMTYNPTNDLLSREEASGTSTALKTTHTYDGGGHLTQTVVNPVSPDPGTPDSNITTIYTYTANDQLDTETDPLGRVTKYAYDTYGNLTSTTKNFVSGQPQTADQNVVSSSAYYQATAAGKAGLPTSETDPVGKTSTHTYDLLGRETTEVLPGDSSIPVLTRTTSYDQLGNTVTVTESWTGTARTTTSVYDLLNRQTSVTDPSGAVTTTAFDIAGDSTATTTTDGTTTRSYDGLGRVVEEGGADGSLTDHAYDAQGHETQMSIGTPGAMVVTTHTYDRAGRTVSDVEDATGLALTTAHTYDAIGRELTTTDPNGVVTTNTYDQTGRLTRTVVAAKTTDTTYDKAGNGLTVTGPYASGQSGQVTKSVYDHLDRLTQSIANYISGSADQSANLTTVTYYDAAGQTLGVVDPKSIVSRTIVNARGVASETIDNCTDSGTIPSPAPASCVGAGTHNGSTNLVSDLTYDGSGAKLTTTRQQQAGGVRTDQTYDAAGHLIKTVVDAASGGLQLTSESAYDGAGHQVASRDPRGTVARSFYDASGRLTKTVVNCTDVGQQVPTTNWAACAGTGDHDATWNLTTAYAYDARGNKTSEVGPTGRETRFGYDGADHLIWKTDNFVDDPQPDPDANLTTYHYYDDAGHEVAVKAPTSDRDSFAVTRSFYDDSGRLTSQIINCTSTGTLVPADPATCTGLGTANASTNLVTSFSYDARGNKLSMTAPIPSDGATGTATVTTRYAYDGADRLCRVLENASVDLQTLADPCSTVVSGTATSNVSTTYGYDAAGNLTRMTDGNGHTTTYAFDGAGRMTGRTDADVATVIWDYDERGNRTSQHNRTDGGAASVTWTYDGADRMSGRTADGVTNVYGYDAEGNLTSAGGPVGTITATYDRLNRPLTVTAEDNSQTAYTYGLASSTRSDPSGSYTFGLDAFGRETAAQDPLHAPSFGTTYRADGQPATRDEPNGNHTAFGYDPVGRLLTKLTTGSGATDVAAPSTPTGLTATAASSTRINLAWAASSDDFGVVRYRIYRGGSQISEVAGAATSYSDYSVVPSTAYAYTVQALDAAGNASAQSATANATTPAGGGTTINLQVAGSYDDMYAYEDAGSGSYSRISTHIFAADSTPTSYDYRSGVRFRAVGVPVGASITSAYLTLTSDTTQSTIPATTIKGEAADNPSDYANDNHTTFLARARTTASQSWTPSAWVSGTAYTSPSVSSVVQEIVSRPGWASGNALALFWEAADGVWGGSNNRLSAYSYDGNSTKGAGLSISYTTPDTTVPSVPTGLAAAAYGPNQINLAWSASTDNVAVQGYRVYRDSVLLATTASTTYADTGLVTAASHTYTVAAIDGAGNASPQSGSVGATTDSGGTVTRASYTYTYNRAGQRLSEASTITGDPTNGTATFAYDALARLTGYMPPTTSNQTYTWQSVPNRSSVQIGNGTPTTTSFDAANRPLSDSTGGTYTSDADGRLTARPGQRLDWDRLGRLSDVKPSVGNTPIATYSYDALDRLRTVDYGGGNKIRFRYAGASSAAAQVVADADGSTQLNVGVAWDGGRLLDWTDGGLLQRTYGQNGHGDTTWIGGPTGIVIGTLRYDPWGSVASSTGPSLPNWRWQGSWFDPSTTLYWVETRWYAPSVGAFLSEDSLLGQPGNPRSRHLYAYVSGEPVGQMDANGEAASQWFVQRMMNYRHMTGRIEIALFISAAWVTTLSNLGVIGRGDNRGFVWGADCTRTRVCIGLDFSNNRVVTVVRPSCGYVYQVAYHGYGYTGWSPYHCNDAYPINTFPWRNSIWASEEWWSGKLRVWWRFNDSLINPAPFVSSIDGWLDVYPPNSDWDSTPRMIFSWDGYPSAEAYSFRNGITRALLRQKEGSIWNLAEWVGDVVYRSNLYMWYPGYSG
jgi:RHS repeat-associated protein